MSKKKKEIKSEKREQPIIKIKTSEDCKACKSMCERGKKYIELMDKPNAIGKGVACLGKM